MEEKLLSHRGNKIQLKIDILHNHQTKFISQESKKYACGGVVFQIQVHSARCSKYNCTTLDQNIVISARFVKMLKDDSLTYICNINSAAFEKEDFTFTQDEMWQNVYLYNKTDLASTENFNYTFDVTVECDIAPTVAPFKLLYEDEDFTDFVLKGAGGNITVHRLILVASSPVFKKMVNGNWKEASEGSVTVPGATKDTLKHFKDYIYLHKLPESNIEQLLLLGSYYMMPDLVQKCLVKLLNDLSLDNAIDLIEVTNLLLVILQHIQSGLINMESITANSLLNMCEDIGSTLKL